MAEEKLMDKLVALCRRRGFIFQSSEIYGGINGFWDYGPLGVELKKNIKEAWWHDMVRNPPPGPDGKDHVAVALEGSNILLDEDMRRALEETRKPELARVWAAFSPTGRIDFKGAIDVCPDGPGEAEPEIDLTVIAKGCSVRPEFFDYQLDELHGQVRYAHDWVTLTGLRARHGEFLSRTR